MWSPWELDLLGLQDNGCLFTQSRLGKAEPLDQANNNVRYPGFDPHPHSSRWTLAVREDHQSDTAVNTLAAIDVAAKSVTTIVSGPDFYAHPEFSPDVK